MLNDTVYAGVSLWLSCTLLAYRPLCTVLLPILPVACSIMNFPAVLGIKIQEYRIDDDVVPLIIWKLVDSLGPEITRKLLNDGGFKFLTRLDP